MVKSNAVLSIVFFRFTCKLTTSFDVSSIRRKRTHTMAMQGDSLGFWCVASNVCLHVSVKSRLPWFTFPLSSPS